MVHKAIDLDSSRVDGEEIIDFVCATPAYISPEVAVFAVDQNAQHHHKNFRCSQKNDIFALGLIVWEMANSNVSLWECFGVRMRPVVDTTSILDVAMRLRDEDVEREIARNFPGDVKRPLRAWLTDALKINPVDRYTAKQLKSSHCLFGNMVSHVFDVSNLVTKTDLFATQSALIHNADLNITRVLTSIDELADVIKEGFISLHMELSNVSAKACLGDKRCADAILELRAYVSRVKETGADLQIEAIKKMMESRGIELSSTKILSLR
jgi:serine/threonine protein kinase